MSWPTPKLTQEQQDNLRIMKENPDGSVVCWNPAKEKNPDAKDNQSRNGFLYNPYFHPLGKFFQGKLKGSIVKTIEFVHSGILRYDKDAYVYDDPRLQQIEQTGKNAILTAFSDRVDEVPYRTIPFMNKILDIVLFLMKEDIYYRWRFIRIIQDVGKAVEHLEPTGEELANMEMES